MLYDSHLVMMRIRKTNVYELKHWLPLRLFDAYKVPDGEGASSRFCSDARSKKSGRPWENPDV